MVVVALILVAVVAALTLWGFIRLWRAATPPGGVKKVDAQGGYFGFVLGLIRQQPEPGGSRPNKRPEHKPQD